MQKPTFLVNGRRVVHQNVNGAVTTMSVNLTGPQKIPVPYPLKADTRDLQNLCSGLIVDGYPCATIESYLSHSTGDEAGDGGGIFSTTISGRCDFITASPDTTISPQGMLRVDGKAVIREQDLCLLNNRNTAPTPLLIVHTNLANAEPDAAVPTTNPTTPYAHKVTIAQHKNLLQHAYLEILNANQQHQILLSSPQHPYPRHPERSEGSPDTTSSYAGDPSFVGMTCKNLQPAPLELSLVIPTVDGQNFKLTLPSLPNPEAPNAWRTLTLQNKFVNISQLPAVLRHVIYQNWVDENWQMHLCPSLKHEVRAMVKDMTLPPGFLYLWRNGEFWREWQVLEDGLLQEINVSKYPLQDKRPATALPCDGVLLPDKIGNNAFTYEIAFAAKQWSVARMQFYKNANNRSSRFIKLSKNINICSPVAIINAALEDLAAVNAEIAIFRNSPRHPELCEGTPVSSGTSSTTKYSHYAGDPSFVGMTWGVTIFLTKIIKQQLQTIEFNDQLADFFSLGQYNYEQGFALIASILSIGKFDSAFLEDWLPCIKKYLFAEQQNFNQEFFVNNWIMHGIPALEKILCDTEDILPAAFSTIVGQLLANLTNQVSKKQICALVWATIKTIPHPVLKLCMQNTAVDISKDNHGLMGVPQKIQHNQYIIYGNLVQITQKNYQIQRLLQPNSWMLIPDAHLLDPTLAAILQIVSSINLAWYHD